MVEAKSLPKDAPCLTARLEVVPGVGAPGRGCNRIALGAVITCGKGPAWSCGGGEDAEAEPTDPGSLNPWVLLSSGGSKKLKLNSEPASKDTSAVSFSGGGALPRFALSDWSILKTSIVSRNPRRYRQNNSLPANRNSLSTPAKTFTSGSPPRWNLPCTHHTSATPFPTLRQNTRQTLLPLFYFHQPATCVMSRHSALPHSVRTGAPSCRILMGHQV